MTKLPWTLLNSVFLVAFNLIFFLAKGTDNPVAVWISYGIVHFSYIMLLLTPFFTTQSRSVVVFSFSLYYISALYFFWNLIVNIIIILFEPESYLFTATINSIITGMYLIIFIGNIIANMNTAKKEHIRQGEIYFIKNCASEIGIILNDFKDTESKYYIEKIYDAIKYSPSKSSPIVNGIEQEISRDISMLKNFDGNDVDNMKLATNNILQKIAERNRVLRLQN